MQNMSIINTSETKWTKKEKERKGKGNEGKSKKSINGQQKDQKLRFIVARTHTRSVIEKV
jgi:hypothetical protein